MRSFRAGRKEWKRLKDRKNRSDRIRQWKWKKPDQMLLKCIAFFLCKKKPSNGISPLTETPSYSLHWKLNMSQNGKKGSSTTQWGKNFKKCDFGQLFILIISLCPTTESSISHEITNLIDYWNCLWLSSDKIIRTFIPIKIIKFLYTGKFMVFNMFMVCLKESKANFWRIASLWILRD